MIYLFVNVVQALYTSITLPQKMSENATPQPEEQPTIGTMEAHGAVFNSVGCNQHNFAISPISSMYTTLTYQIYFFFLLVYNSRVIVIQHCAGCACPGFANQMFPPNTDTSFNRSPPNHSTSLSNHGTPPPNIDTSPVSLPVSKTYSYI